MISKWSIQELQVAAHVICCAESVLGILTVGQRADLLLDKLSWLKDSVEAHEILEQIKRYTMEAN
jgi:hypothetical protein